MSGGARALIAILLAAAVVEAACLAFLWKRSSWQRVARQSPVQRGQAIAETMGCFGCHGPGGARPIPNPGAKGGEVPAWVGGTWMMWNRNASDVRAWILEGRPSGRPPDEGALITMPAYRSRLSDAEVDDLVAYVLAASHFGAIADDRAAAGHETAYRLGCFGCHGPEGRGLISNPGSYKGYIPAWDGEDYAELVRDEAEFGQWVRHGISDRFRANPVAGTILTTQTVKMPAYGDRVTDDDLRNLHAYVLWVRAHPRSP